jgi:hypothetical protein
MRRPTVRYNGNCFKKKYRVHIFPNGRNIYMRSVNPRATHDRVLWFSASAVSAQASRPIQCVWTCGGTRTDRAVERFSPTDGADCRDVRYGG